MSIQDVGSIGELIAAIATLGTLAYLAIQVRQNTRALQSSTFQEITNDMSISSEAVCTHPVLAEVLTRGNQEGMQVLSTEEQMRYSFFFLMTFRRLESVFMQRRLGFIDPELTQGFERSVLSAIISGGGAEWWARAKPAFSEDFAAHVDQRLAGDEFPSIHPGLGAQPR